MFRFWNRVIIFILAFGGSTLLFGQTLNTDIRPKANSPLSRFGLGDLVNQQFAASSGFAGLSAAFNDPLHLNLLNPASLAHLQATAFEVGVYGRYSNLKNPNESLNAWSGNLQYMALGFTLKNPINQALDRVKSPVGLGMSISLQPYSLVGYDILTENEVNQAGEPISNVPWAQNYINSLKGEGGTYRFSWGNAIRYKGFAFGLNLSYIFGKITNNTRVELAESSFDYFTEFLNETSVRGLIWDAGFQYTHSFKKTNNRGGQEASGKRLVFGATFGDKNDINTFSSKFHHRDSPSFNPRGDTILLESGVKNKGALPSRWRAGLMYEEINKFRLGFEFSQAAWSQYVNEAKPENLSDSWRFSLGAEFIPEALSYNNYFRRVRYRAGFFYGADPRSLNGEQVNHTGLTLGLGFPIILPRQQVSFINLAIEGGKIGIKDVLTENYVQMTVGFTLNDNTWFFKRKFN